MTTVQEKLYAIQKIHLSKEIKNTIYMCAYSVVIAGHCDCGGVATSPQEWHVIIYGTLVTLRRISEAIHMTGLGVS